jgi:acetyl-CoA carboxylase biotin carboxylase subunit
VTARAAARVPARILVANRGEVAVRVIRACQEMGLETVAVYSPSDRAARHVRMAGTAMPLGGDAPADSYLRIDRLLDAARRSGADAVHPGYGFLSENAAFAAACREAGLTFIGPSPEAMAQLGSKTTARRLAVAAGVPVVPGTDAPLGPEASEAEAAEAASRVGFPLLVKAVSGGGGRGMRAVASPDELPGALRAARSEAGTAFGDSAVYLERRLDRPRHVEVQILADHHGAVLPFVERECSIQRRHQKVVEESPATGLPDGLRDRLLDAAAAVAGAAGYTNAGTVEFLVDPAGRFYFLEMNTRLQVEHPVTEMVTGVDLVRWQIRIAGGEPLSIVPDPARTPAGHAIECRIYAEDPDRGFLPSPGRVTALRTPGGPGVRDDGWVEAGTDVPLHYDALLSKLVVWGADRQEAVARLGRALAEYDIRGVATTLPFFRWLVAQRSFVEGRCDTMWLDALLQQPGRRAFSTPDPSVAEVAAVAVALVEAAGLGTAEDGDAIAEARTRETVGSRWKARGRREGLRR